MLKVMCTNNTSLTAVLGMIIRNYIITAN